MLTVTGMGMDRSRRYMTREFITFPGLTLCASTVGCCVGNCKRSTVRVGNAMFSTHRLSVIEIAISSYVFAKVDERRPC